MRHTALSTLAAAGFAGAMFLWSLGISFVVNDRALAMPNGWTLAFLDVAMLVALAALERKALVVVGAIFGGGAIAVAVFVAMLSLNSEGSFVRRHTGAIFESIAAIIAIAPVWWLARSRRHARVVLGALVAVPLAFSIWTRIPRRVSTAEPTRESIERLATRELTKDDAPVRVVAFELGEATSEHYSGGEARTYRWTATVEMTDDGWWNVCPAMHTREGFTREPMKNPENATPCMNTPHAKGTRMPHGGSTSFMFRPNVGWVGPDNLVH